MKMKGVRNLREMTRLLDADLRLRKLCLIKKKEADWLRLKREGSFGGNV
jgi:hypothetical protein